MPIPILDTWRFVRPGRRIEWPVSRRVYFRFQELLHELVDLEDADQQDSWTHDRMATLRDDIRHLPGYPRKYDPNRDVIDPVITTAQR